MKEAFVFWLTGLSGAGKSTIAKRFADILTQEGHSVKILDGDDIRENKHQKLKFTVKDIQKNNELIAKLCLKEIKNYDFILVTVISPFIESRNKNCYLIGKNYNEIYIKVAIATAIKRDTKGLYKKALEGEINNFIGISEHTPYEEPQNPELVIDTNTHDIENSVNLLVNFAKKITNPKRQL